MITQTMFPPVLIIQVLQMLVLVPVRSQPEISPPGLRMRSREPFTNKTIDQLITEALGGIELAANKMLAPGENILAELDMMLTQNQFVSLYEPPSSYRAAVPAAPTANLRVKRKAIRDVILRWTNNEIPYTFARGHFSDKETYMIKQAMTEWERYTCLSFRPANERDRNVLHFQNGEGCNSQLGMVGGVQVLNLEEGGCRFMGLYLHEIGHAIGLVHEHQLPDRDQYISILFEHVAPQMRIWFNKYDREKISVFKNPVHYEYSSVMHYGINAFSYDGRSQTIRAVDRSREKEIGRVYLKQLAFSDVKAVNLMYKCGELCPKTVVCGQGGFVDQNCRCVCPDGSQDCDESRDSAFDETCVNEEMDWKCGVWAQQGECERNEPYMSGNCRKACRLCGVNKEEEENHFTTWAWQWFGMFTSLLPPDWIIGVCQDAYPVAKCQKWKEQGDCVTNAGWMSRNCRRTCEACQEDKSDNSSTSCVNIYEDDEKCEEWAVDGECKINPSWMSRNCARSCHTCNKPDVEEEDEEEDVEKSCYDQYNSDKCKSWASQGECAVNPTWMVPNCRKSCNKCYEDDACKNLYDDQQCQIWAADGECEANPGWMKINCRMACKECGTGTGAGRTDPPGRDDPPPRDGTTSSVDPTGCPNQHNDVECDMWAKFGHCDINPLWMLQHCRRSCKSCNTGPDAGSVTGGPQARCYDEDSSCESWARSGFCESNPRYNLIHCKKACDNCNGCRDTHVLCPVWAKALHCEINAVYMLRECQRSCKIC